MKPLSYLDFEISVRKENGRYTAEVVRSPAGKAQSRFESPFPNEYELKYLMGTLGHVSRVARGSRSYETEAAKQLGEKLFNALFSGQILDCFRKSLARADTEDVSGLRIRIGLRHAADLADLPWEFLFDPDRTRRSFLALSHTTPIVRYIETPGHYRPLDISLPLKILAVISSPEDKDYPRLNVEKEKNLLTKALEPLEKKGRVRVTWLEKGAVKALMCALRRGVYHVFHFIGHGQFDTERDEGLLVMEDEDRRAIKLNARGIVTLLHDYKRSIRLAVLNACEAGRTSRTDPFAGVAAALVRQGIPAVAAMQFEISDEAAVFFADEFYSALCDGFSADTSVAEARKRINLEGDEVEWGTPVLYTSSRDGILFRFPEGSAEQRYQESVSDKYQTDQSGHNIEIIQPEALVKEPITGMEFILVPSGIFTMGDIFGEGDADEYPLHEVQLDSFYMGKYPVTQKQWIKIMGGNPSEFRKGDDYPVENVSWYDVQVFVKKLVESNDKKYKFRLPTEAEWEYAARSGGRKEKYAGSDDADLVAWYESNSSGSTHPVGKKKPNGLGIYDMSGNVWEWCLDLHESYPTGSVKNPIKYTSGSCPIFRGGSWSDTERVCRSSYRIGASADKYGEHLGFRLIKVP